MLTDKSVSHLDIRAANIFAYILFSLLRGADKQNMCLNRKKQNKKKTNMNGVQFLTKYVLISCLFRPLFKL